MRVFVSGFVDRQLAIIISMAKLIISQCYTAKSITLSYSKYEYRLPIADCRLPIADCRLPIADCRLPIADCRLPIADCRLPIVD
jgi:hypothetical protein